MLKDLKHLKKPCKSFIRKGELTALVYEKSRINFRGQPPEMMKSSLLLFCAY